MMSFVPGWHPDHAKVAAERAESAGVPRVAFRAPSAPTRPAYSLTRHRRRSLEQGQVGTCWEHAGTQAAEIFLAAHNGSPYDICRNLVGYGGKQLEGGGNPANGGSPTSALRALSDDPQGGIGIAHESLWPYVADARYTGSRPPSGVVDDARKRHLFASALIHPGSDFDAIAALIDRDIPVANGIWWPYDWDNGQSIMTGIGRGTYGHALLIVGYAQPGVIHQDRCIHLDNWHGQLYPPLTPDVAAKVEGYKPTTASTTSDFWVTWTAYMQAVSMSPQWTEHVAATDADGLEQLTLADALAL
jgi:hypothetical protein